MAKFTYFIRERVKLNGVERGTNFETSIEGINYADGRVMSIPSGSFTQIINLSALPGAGTFPSSSIKYARITNESSGAINLKVSGSTSQINMLLEGSGSFIFNSGKISNTFDSFNYGDLLSISATPQDTQSTVSYFVVTT